jgi:hypothetical protein
MTLTLVGMTKRENMVDLKYGETFDAAETFVLTVSPKFVAQRTGRSGPVSGPDMQAFVLGNVSWLKATAEDCKGRGLTSEVL